MAAKEVSGLKYGLTLADKFTDKFPFIKSFLVSLPYGAGATNKFISGAYGVLSETPQDWSDVDFVLGPLFKKVFDCIVINKVDITKKK